MPFPIPAIAGTAFFTMVAHVFAWAITGGLTRFITGSGIALVTFGVLNTLLEEGLQLVVSQVGLLGEAAQIVYIAGISEALSIIGSAMTAVIAIRAASISLTRKGVLTA